MSEQPKFEKGAVVRLKSGGPKMTVRGVGGMVGGLICQWFEGNKLQEGNFDEESLEIAKDGPSTRELTRG